MQKSSISEKIKELRTNLEDESEKFLRSHRYTSIDSIQLRKWYSYSIQRGIADYCSKISCLTGLVVWIIRKQNTNFYSERCHLSFTPDE